MKDLERRLQMKHSKSDAYVMQRRLCNTYFCVFQLLAQVFRGQLAGFTISLEKDKQPSVAN